MSKRQRGELKRQLILVALLVMMIILAIGLILPLLNSSFSIANTAFDELTGQNNNTGELVVIPISDSSAQGTNTVSTTLSGLSLDEALAELSVPDFDGETPWVVIHDNTPFFEDNDITTDSYLQLSDLDSLGRVGQATACIGKDMLPLGEERGDISSVKPTGWVQAKYSIVDQSWLYNRCHIVGWQLCGLNAEKKNLMTGTRFFNVQGMLPFENMVADYIRETGEHAMYRITPIFDGDNLVANGIIMEGYSVEDEGETVCFCVYVYNAQPGIVIDYATGESYEDEAYIEIAA